MNVVVVKDAPSHTGPVDVHLAPETSSGAMLFQMDFRLIWDKFSGAVGETPKAEDIAAMKAKARELGADSITVRCGAFGTVGLGYCKVAGYKK
jgi:hypothetical protein